MATLPNMIATYEKIGQREQLKDGVETAYFDRTPMQAMSGKGKTKGTDWQWLTRELRPARKNANVEGKQYDGNAYRPSVRLRNICQIFEETFGVSGSAEASQNADPLDVIARETKERTMEVGLDIEKAMLDNNPWVNGDLSTPREAAGIITYMSANTQAGVGGVDATGDGTNARTDASQANQRVITEQHLKTALTQTWESGGMRPLNLLARPEIVDTIATFEGDVLRRNHGKPKVIQSDVDMYMTKSGILKVGQSAHIRPNDVGIFDSSQLKVVAFRPFARHKMGIKGDSYEFLLNCEKTFEFGNPKGHAFIFDVKAA